MLQQRVPVWAIVAVAVLVLVGVSSMAHSAGWSDGYQLGLLTTAAGGKLPPQALHHAGWGYHHGGFGGFFGGFFRFLFFLFFLGLIAKFFGFWRWRMHGGHGGPGHHPWRHDGPWGGSGAQSAPDPQAKPEQPQATPQAAAGEAGVGNPQPVVWV